MPSNSYDNSATFYGFAFPGDRAAIQQASLIAFHLKPGARVLEIGAGIGDLALALVASGFQVVALEEQESLFAVLLSRCAVNQDAIQRLTPIPVMERQLWSQFDCVVAVNVLSQVDAEQRDRILDVAVDSMAADAFLVISASQPTPLREEREWESIARRSVGEAVLEVFARSAKKTQDDHYLVQYQYSLSWHDQLVLEQETSHDVHLIRPRDMAQQLEQRGLTVDRAYSTWLGQDYDALGGSYILVARRNTECE